MGFVLERVAQGKIYIRVLRFFPASVISVMFQFIFLNPITCRSGSGSSVGIATGYRLDGPGIEFPWRRDFPHLPRPVLGPNQPPVKRIPGLSRVRVTRHHPHCTHDLRSGSQDHHSSKNSVQKTICCNSTSNAPDDGRMYPKHVERRLY